MSVKRKKKQQKIRRAERTHAKVRATSARPRLAVFRSSKHFYGQLIDDSNNQTLCSCSTLEIENLSGDKILVFI